MAACCTRERSRGAHPGPAACIPTHNTFKHSQQIKNRLKEGYAPRLNISLQCPATDAWHLGFAYHAVPQSHTCMGVLDEHGRTGKSDRLRWATFKGPSSCVSVPAEPAAAVQPACCAACSSSERCSGEGRSSASSRNMPGASASSASAKRCCSALAGSSPCLQSRQWCHCSAVGHRPRALRQGLCHIRKHAGRLRI